MGRKDQNLMATNITEADSFNATCSAPDDGDTASAASLVAPGTGLQVLADRTRYLYNRNIAAKGGTLYVPMCVMYNASTRFTAFAGGVLEQTSVASAGQLDIQIPPVYGAALTGITAYVHGDYGLAGPHAALPGTMPRLNAQKLGLTTATISALGTATDTSATVGAYESYHTIEVTFSPYDFVTTESVHASFFGETGANSLAAALYLFGITATYAIT